MSHTKRGFTMIEILIVILIIGILVTIVTFGFAGARASARDSKRKADLEQMAVGLELYRTDCGSYPAPSGGWLPSPLQGGGSPSGCSGVYIDSPAVDPQAPTRRYSYSRPSASTYVLCASLEQPPSSTNTSGCGACGQACNYRITSP